MSGFLLRRSNLSTIKLQQLDIYLRKLINLKIGEIPLTKEKFYLITPN
jgi:hypothetical protein